MNGFQLGFIESILEISSYHVRIEHTAEARLEGAVNDNTLEHAARIINRIPFVKAAVPFAEMQGIIRGATAQSQQIAVVRALPPDALAVDLGLAKRLVFEQGSFNLHDPSSILLGAEAAARLGVETGDTVSFLSLSGLIPSSESTVDAMFTVRGVFRSEFYEYDLGWAFINLDRAREMEDGLKIILGIKIADRFADQHALLVCKNRLVGTLPGVDKLKFSSWRDYNKAFFGALRTEKLFMFILVGLIFIVAGIQIFQSQRRLVLERSDEIGLLRAIGAEVFEIRCIFALGGVIIGGLGAVIGLALALVITINISPIFRALENAVNGILGLFQSAGGFAVFSPAVFYLKDIPARLIPSEVILIFLFGFFSAVIAGWVASNRAARIRPAEALRYE